MIYDYFRITSTSDSTGLLLFAAWAVPCIHTSRKGEQPITAPTKAHFLRMLDLCIAQKGMQFEHMLKPHKPETIVKKRTATNVEDDDEL